MRLKLARPIVFFDIETTGLDVEADRIVELAAIKLRPDGSREEKHRRFNPLIPIPKEATRIHRITDDDVKDEQPFYKVARGEKGIAAYFAGCDLGGFNVIRFDIPILKKELERAGETLDLSQVAVVDVQQIFYAKEPRDLSAAVRFYCNREHENAHRALDDIKATWDVLAAQLDRYADLPDIPADLERDVRKPDIVDRLGKLRWQDGEVALSFGKHRGRTLRYLADEDPDYLRWMIENELAPDAAHLLRDALIGKFAAKATE